MSDWKARLTSDISMTPFKEYDGDGEPIVTILKAEGWLRKHGSYGAYASIYFEPDGEIHYVLTKQADESVEITNTRHCKWPVYGAFADGNDTFNDEDEKDFKDIEPDEPEPKKDDGISQPGQKDEDDEPDEGDGEEGDEVIRRIFTRMFDGRRWRKQAIARQIQKVEFGLIDEELAEQEGDYSAVARQKQVRVTYKREPEAETSTFQIVLPENVELTRHQGYTGVKWFVEIPNDAELNVKGGKR
jgi:hypothetical protein